MRALVIDDSRAMRKILANLLGKVGFGEIAEAEHGKAGLAQLGVMQAPDLILVDWNMPEMNGLEFVRALRQDARYADVRVMMVTTETEVSQVMLALEAGANEYLMKPFTPEMIADKLAILGLAPAA